LTKKIKNIYWNCMKNQTVKTTYSVIVSMLILLTSGGQLVFAGKK